MILSNEKANSIIDRLTENDHIRSLKDSILSDLSDLLNARLFETSQDSLDSELQNSLLSYGLPNFSALEISAQDSAGKIKDKILSLITIHEPRLKNVEIAIDRVEKSRISFKISALLLNDPDPIEIKFDSHYQPVTRQFINNNSQEII